ncbi:MAG: RagB/SusD family nutrient uptake outer membrane protein [Muribaculaceae bacterium]|nr:RagB/SusD family nutrient uptake outer membrane protein [Muribaculaceae bacterium]
MRNKILTIAFAAFALSLSSCNDYLDKQPMDSSTDENNWVSEASLQTFSWKLYNNFSGYGTGWSRGQYLNEGMSDDYSADGYSQPTSNAPSTSGSWNNPYEEIRRANILLERVDIVPNLTDATANHWRGVARFFRAQQHFDLVKTYGDVVWVDKVIDVDDVAKLGSKRDSRVDVMKNVCTDLQFAADNCAATTDNTVNNMVAYALLSRVALYEGAWQRYHENNAENAKYFYTIAKNAASAIISSGKYTIHDNYQSNYLSKSLKGNSEMILYKVYQYTGEGAAATLAHSMQGWCNSSSKTWGLTKSAVEAFANADGLPIYMSTYSDATVEDVFKNRDTRLSKIIEPNVLCPVGMAYTEGVNSSTGYWTNKFVLASDYGTGTWLAPYNTTDAPLFSYSEVLENYAEACAELGTITQNDLDISINIVRQKHGNLPAYTLAGGALSVAGKTITHDPKNTFGVSDLLWELRRERRSELMCDGFRYDDLMRWKLGALLDFDKNPDGYLGASKAAIDAFYNAHKGETIYKGISYDDIIGGNFWNSNNTYLSAFNTAKNKRVFDETKNYLEPLPSTEITLNPNLKPNNPGW